MAKASIQYKSSRPISSVTLVMSLEEAQVLCSLLSNIGGDSDGPRGKIDAIFQALSDTEAIESISLDRETYRSERDGSMYISEAN